MRKFLSLLCFAASLAIAGAKQPNVIVVMTDDQGYGEMSVHGNPVLKTPHLDRLHSQSVRLEDFHVAPMCTPTRGQFLTGLDAARNGAINVSSGRTLLRRDLPTIADVFGKAGYRTGLFGKWHLGDTYPYRPQDRGFQEVVWFPSSHINSTPDVWDNDYFDDTYRTQDGLKQFKGYCTDVFFREGIDWMKERVDKGESFFCFLPMNAPHWPHWVPDQYREAMRLEMDKAESAGRVKVDAKKREALISYLAMIRNIDDNIGRLEIFLRESDIADDTIVVFLTDNGSTFAPDYFPAGMRGRKTQLWEGGHRVPCFIRWPNGNLGKPRGIGGLTQVQDLLPTLAFLGGVKSPDRLDGINLSPVFRGEAEVTDDRMLVINYSRMPHGFEYPSPDSQSLMRREGAGVLWKRWRLLENKALYDLRSDPMQRQNVIGKHPEVVAKMRAHLDSWWNQVKDVANEPQPVVIGHPKEDPIMLTACEWLDVFIDQQAQVRRADLKNGWWEIDVTRAGPYEVELRRWPREADVPIRDGVPAAETTDGSFIEGMALPIARARIRIGTRAGQSKPVGPNTRSVKFTVGLKPGRTRLYTWFDDERHQPVVGAYYLYLKKK